MSTARRLAAEFSGRCAAWPCRRRATWLVELEDGPATVCDDHVPESQRAPVCASVNCRQPAAVYSVFCEGHRHAVRRETRS